MKKNTVMRVLSLILVLTLMSTCAISGTFAKYVTKAEGADQARVAKWGVLVSVDGGAFAEKYAATDAKYLAAEGVYSVESSVEGEMVVAPGTSSAEADANLVATVTGTPEVATRYILETKGVEDVVLKAGKYTDYTQLGADGTYSNTFELTKDYAPIKWNLKITKMDDAGNALASIDLAAKLYEKLPANYMTAAENLGMSKDGCSIFDAIAIIKAVAGNDNYVKIVGDALGEVVNDGRNFQLEVDGENLKLSYDFDPNKTMNFKFELTWEWAFEQENVELYDKADTFLGNVAAGVATSDNANTTIKAGFVATAVQID